jgi:bifunctional non-homologous end joining protein LigD
MPKRLFEPCIPTRGTKVPHHPDWIHEVKHDGFRMIVAKDGERVRLFTRNGHDWTSRYPLIVETAHRIRSKQFVLDGEAVLLDLQGLSDFDGLMSRQHRVLVAAAVLRWPTGFTDRICADFDLARWGRS